MGKGGQHGGGSQLRGSYPREGGCWYKRGLAHGLRIAPRQLGLIHKSLQGSKLSAAGSFDVHKALDLELVSCMPSKFLCQ